MKKVITIMMCLAMVLGMTVSVGAEAADTHSYKAYQIFSGTATTDEKGATILSNVQWGSGINSTAFLTEIVEDNGCYFDESFADCTTAKQVAKVIGGWSESSSMLKAFTKLADKNKAGDGSAIGSDLSAGYYLVVDTTNVEGVTDAKNEALLVLSTGGEFAPTIKRSVPALDKKVSAGGAAMADYCTAAAGDTLDFCMTATLPSNIAFYDSYKLVFHDALSSGLNYVYEGANSDVTVKIGGKAVEAQHYVASFAASSMSVTINDVKKIANVTADTKVTVSYQAKVTSQAAMGNAANTNSAYLEYSNNSNYGGTGLGKTPIDVVRVFLLGLKVNKVDQNDKALTGATFKLYRKTGSGDSDWTLMTEDSRADVASSFQWSRLDAGQYKLVETVTPSGYDTMEDKIFTLEPKIEANASTGVYELKSVTAGKVSGNASTGIVTMKIQNVKGSILPNTGGVGTGLFYFIGAMLISGGAIIRGGRSFSTHLRTNGARPGKSN